MRLSIWSRGLLFVAVFSALQLGWQSARGTWLEYLVIHDGTVRPAAALVSLLTPDARASAVGFSLRAPAGGLAILNGCEGIEVLFLLVAAFCVAAISWQQRLVGLLLGVVVVFLLNQARVLVLFYAYRADPDLFDLLHASIAPIAVILIASIYFYAWLAYASRNPAASD